MTRRTNSRVAGFTFLAYIAVGIPAMILSGKATRGDGVAAQLTSIAQHVGDMRLASLLDLSSCFAALVLGVTLYALTRDQDPDIAMLGLTCRVGEGLISGVSVSRSLSLVWLATSGIHEMDAQAAGTLGAFLLNGRGFGITAIFFAVGSLCFSWLLFRGRMIPALLAGYGVIVSALLVVGLPLQLVNVLPQSLTWFLWIPMALFEIPLAVWLLVKGARPAPSLAT